MPVFFGSWYFLFQSFVNCRISHYSKSRQRHSRSVPGFLWILFFLAGILPALSQSTEVLHQTLQSLHQGLLDHPDPKKGALVTHRALNLVLANKIGFYFSDYDNLSYFKNTTSFHSLDGFFSLQHNLFQPSQGDQWVRSYVLIGVRANIVGEWRGLFSQTPVPHEVGATLSKSWIASPKIRYQGDEAHPSVLPDHKQEMDLQRAYALQQVEEQMNREEEAFAKYFSKLSQKDFLGQDTAEAKAKLRAIFYKDQEAKSQWKFAYLQAQALLTTRSYLSISTHWTTLSGYLPVLPLRYSIASSSGTAYKMSYPFEIRLSHTRFRESTQWGKFYLTFCGGVLGNDSPRSKALALYGTALATVAPSSRDDFRYFVTPFVRGHVVFFPPESHIGVDLLLEQNMGTYHATNAQIGIPIVLIDKERYPAANFQFLLRLPDLGDSMHSGRSLSDKMVLGLSVGMPFSKMIY